MILKQIYLECLSQASYFIGDEATRTAVVVDPRRDVQVYLDEAAALGLTIRHVILTHFHADFVSGHLELREKTGAVLHLGRRAEAEYEFEPLLEGEPLRFGNVRLEFLETPGHTPESVSVLVYDLQRSPRKPLAVLTGDTLFIGDVGRPDLMASKGVSAEELADLLYDSLRQKLLTLPDETLVYPAHGAGSACGKSLSTETVSTIGDQRRFNYALQPMDREEFVRIVTSGLGQAPAYFGYDAQRNREQRPVLEDTLEAALKPLSLAEVLRLQEEGAQVVDTRDADDFASRHLAGSLDIGLEGRFADWAGRILTLDRPIVLIAEPGKEWEAGMRLGRIGFDHVAGYLDGGPAALAAEPGHCRKVQRFTGPQLARELEAGQPLVVLDVRGPGERELARIEGSLHIPLPELEERIGEVPRDRRVVAHCAGGYRSMIAASLLEKLGVQDPADLRGGIQAWLGAVQAQA